MHRTDADGATVGNLFTEGNPSLSIPATVVGQDWLNDVQEELASLIENEGIALVKGTQDQLADAINLMIQKGGKSGSQISQAILNNQASADNISGLSFDSADFKAGSFEFDIHRQTDTQDEQETGTAFVTYDPVALDWRISVQSSFDDAGIVFDISSGGQVSYTSDDLTGTSYTGTLRVANVKKFDN